MRSSSCRAESSSGLGGSFLEEMKGEQSATVPQNPQGHPPKKAPNQPPAPQTQHPQRTAQGPHSCKDPSPQ